MNSNIKRYMVAFIFGASLGFTLTAICIKLGLPDNGGIRSVILFMPMFWVINYREKIFK
tara:strand:+ start:389 stop:565 length:177 start_codon:yes stop_codon:yes gene_type:complete